MRYLLLLLTVACQTTEPTSSPALPRVLMIGDSQETGYFEPTRRALDVEAVVIDSPGNARTTGHTLAHLDQWLDAAGPVDLITWNNGLHDLSYRNLERTGLRKTEPEDYRANLLIIGRRLLATGADIVFFTSTPVPRLNAGRYPEDVAEYNSIAIEVMAELDIPVYDLHAVASEQMHMLIDAEQETDCHFTREGYERLAEFVVQTIRAHLNDR